MNDYPFQNKDCEVFTDKRSTVIAEENKKRYIAQNKEKDTLCLSKVDPCLIKEGLRCDFLLLNWKKEKAYFIELKGTEFLHALDQIDRSIDLLTKNIPQFKVNARIVSSKIYAPNLKSNKLKRLERKLKKLGGNMLSKVKELKEVV